MSEKTTNDINSNGSELHEKLEGVSSSFDNKKGNEHNNDINAENDGEIDPGNVTNTQETPSIKKEDKTSRTEQLLKTELIKIRADYTACLEREQDLSSKLQKIDFQTVKVAELEILNEELREQLNESLKECGCLKQDLEK